VNWKVEVMRNVSFTQSSSRGLESPMKWRLESLTNQTSISSRGRRCITKGGATTRRLDEVEDASGRLSCNHRVARGWLEVVGREPHQLASSQPGGIFRVIEKQLTFTVISVSTLWVMSDSRNNNWRFLAQTLTVRTYMISLGVEARS
jgi:hypothetical protein